MEYYDFEGVGPRKSPPLAPVRPNLEPDPLNWGSDDETDLEDIIDSVGVLFHFCLHIHFKGLI